MKAILESTCWNVSNPGRIYKLNPVIIEVNDLALDCDRGGGVYRLMNTDSVYCYCDFWNSYGETHQDIYNMSIRFEP